MTVLLFTTGVWFSPAEHPVAFLFALALASGPFLAGASNHALGR
jgi:hypothetical protein